MANLPSEATTNPGAYGYICGNGQPYQHSNLWQSDGIGFESARQSLMDHPDYQTIGDRVRLRDQVKADMNKAASQHTVADLILIKYGRACGPINDIGQTGPKYNSCRWQSGLNIRNPENCGSLADQSIGISATKCFNGAAPDPGAHSGGVAGIRVARRRGQSLMDQGVIMVRRP